MSHQSLRNSNVNVMLGTALLASAAFMAIYLIIDASIHAEMEYDYLSIEHRLQAVETELFPEEVTSEDDSLILAE